MTLKCQCCGFEQDFTDSTEAFNSGWDAPPHFTGYVSCNLCPASYVVLRQTGRHAGAHLKWQTDGRPAEFELPDDVDPDEFAKFKQEVQQLMPAGMTVEQLKAIVTSAALSHEGEKDMNWDPSPKSYGIGDVVVLNRAVNRCRLCGNSIDTSLCAYGCPNDSLDESERPDGDVYIDTWEVTEKLLSKEVYHAPVKEG
jgi:hypothetical protein